MIPRHDLTATLTERSTSDTMEVTLTYYEAIYDEDDPPNLIEPERWEYIGDTFETAPESGIFEDAIRIYCVEGDFAIGLDYDGLVGPTNKATINPFHADFEDGEEISEFSRYSNITVDDPEA